jgi:uncharacterized membrane protein
MRSPYNRADLTNGHSSVNHKFRHINTKYRKRSRQPGYMSVVGCSRSRFISARDPTSFETSFNWSGTAVTFFTLIRLIFVKIFHKTSQIFAVTALALTLMVASSPVAHAQMQSCLDSCANLANSVRQQVVSGAMAQASSTCSQYRQYSGAEASCLASMQSAAYQAGETAASSTMANCSSKCSGGSGGTCN